MEHMKPLIEALRTKLKQALILWAEGFREACCLHRVIVLCRRSKKLMIRTGQCFLLNGFIFLGSLFVLNSVVIPTLQWILPDHYSQTNCEAMSEFHGVFKFYSFLRGFLIQLFYVFWFYPLYVFSFILSNLWYNDIATHGFAAMGRSGPSTVESSKQNDTLTSDSKVHAARPAGLGGIMIGIGEQVYSLLLLTFFFFEVYAAGFIPYVGKALNFVLLSWMYAYYCFEYVFVLTATGTEAEQVISTQRRRFTGAQLGKVPDTGLVPLPIGISRTSTRQQNTITDSGHALVPS
ncbi:hypothetical protein GOBAR_AA14073 [Gossypium barbadense]|uniref:Protein EI24 homolog n=1 Tax=Gossypium barbadense TaxID=3634 RepID=A0A2P5XTF7_GOSBA|nr:hypothetical protein GOBAR_AA14073 [Gossypium barbadense]